MQWSEKPSKQTALACPKTATKNMIVEIKLLINKFLTPYQHALDYLYLILDINLVSSSKLCGLNREGSYNPIVGI